MAETAYELLQRGKELLESKNPAQAAAVLEQAKKLEPEKGSIREALGQAYYNCGQYELAQLEFEKAMEIDPTNHYAYFGLALCLRHLGDKIGALKHLKIAIAMEPGSEIYQNTFARLKLDFQD